MCCACNYMDAPCLTLSLSHVTGGLHHHEDDESAPLRWMAPELVGERHGGVITLDQTKPGNVW